MICKEREEDTHTTGWTKRLRGRENATRHKRKLCEHRTTNIILRITLSKPTNTLQFALHPFILTSLPKKQEQQNDMKMSYSQAAQAASASSSSSAGSASKAPANPPTTPHAAMHWSACFNDRCDVHLRDKEGANWFPKQPRRHQPRRQSKKVHWGEPEGLGNKYDNLGKFVEELQEKMERMEKEMGDLREENRSYKRRCVVAEESARKAGIEARRRAYDNVELKIRVRRAMSEAAALVKELDRDSEYSTAVGLPPIKANGSRSNGGKKDENDDGVISA